MTTTWPVRRPTEAAALAAAARSARGPLSFPAVLADLLTANRAGDRAGVCLCAHRAARSVLGEVGE